MRLFIFLIASIISSCTLNEHLDLQNEYFKEFKQVDTAEMITLDQDYTTSFTRGTIETKYKVVLPAGDYKAIAISKGRIFYLAPEGFKYSKNDRAESLIGGIVQTESSSKENFYAWFVPKDSTLYNRDVIMKMEWIDEVKSGFLNLSNRPWIESDFKIVIQ